MSDHLNLVPRYPRPKTKLLDSSIYKVYREKCFKEPQRASTAELKTAHFVTEHGIHRTNQNTAILTPNPPVTSCHPAVAQCLDDLQRINWDLDVRAEKKRQAYEPDRVVIQVDL